MGMGIIVLTLSCVWGREEKRKPMAMPLSASLLRSVSTVRCRVVAVVGGRGGPIARPFGSVAAPISTVTPPLFLPLLSRRSLARTLSSSRTDEAVSMPTDGGAVADADMNAVQRRLMFEDEWDLYPLLVLSLFWFLDDYIHESFYNVVGHAFVCCRTTRSVYLILFITKIRVFPFFPPLFPL